MDISLTVLTMLEEAGLTDRASVVDPAGTERLLELVRPLYVSLDDLSDPRLGAKSIREEPSSVVRSMLSEAGIGLDERVSVLWLAESTAVEMSFEDFVDHHDDLWYPARDDVWVLSQGLSRFVAISHEEFVLAGDLPQSPRSAHSGLVELTIVSDRREPDELARAVGLKPDRAWRKGESRGPRTCKRHAFNGVVYGSGLADDAHPHEHLGALFARLKPHQARIGALASELAAKPAQGAVRLSFSDLTTAGMPGYHFSPEDLRFISELGAGLNVSIYFSDERTQE